MRTAPAIGAGMPAAAPFAEPDAYNARCEFSGSTVAPGSGREIDAVAVTQ